MPVTYLYTDGACSGNPGPGGWGYIIKNDSLYHEASGGELLTTNNRMELLGIIEGLAYIASLKDRSTEIRVFTDSQYAYYGITKWILDWKKRGWKNAQKEPVKNRELWERLDELSSLMPVEYNWIRGHAGHPENEACDLLARKAIISLQNS